MKKEKVDKGFELNYNNLSYRRKFIRTLWMILWAILLLCFMRWAGVALFILLPLSVIFAVVGFIQALQNYKNWKEEIDKK